MKYWYESTVRTLGIIAVCFACRGQCSHAKDVKTKMADGRQEVFLVFIISDHNKKFPLKRNGSALVKHVGQPDLLKEYSEIP